MRDVQITVNKEGSLQEWECIFTGKGGRHSIPIRQNEHRPSLACIKNSYSNMFLEPGWEAGVRVGRLGGGQIMVDVA